MKMTTRRKRGKAGVEALRGRRPPGALGLSAEGAVAGAGAAGLPPQSGRAFRFPSRKRPKPSLRKIELK